MSLYSPIKHSILQEPLHDSCSVGIKYKYIIAYKRIEEKIFLCIPRISQISLGPSPISTT